MGTGRARCGLTRDKNEFFITSSYSSTPLVVVFKVQTLGSFLFIKTDKARAKGNT
jgi:hypothetical protein